MTGPVDAAPAGAARLGPDFVGRRSPTVHTLDMARGTILVDDAHGTYLALSPTALLIWQCLDGSSTLEAITRDIADVLGAEVSRVLDDATDVLTRMRARGFVMDEHVHEPPRRWVPHRVHLPGSDEWTRVRMNTGSRVVELRATDPGIAAMLRELCAPMLAGEGNATDSVDSVVVIPSAASRGSIPGQHVLLVDGDVVLVTVDVGRVVRAAIAVIGETEPPSGAVRARACSLVRQHRSVMVGGRFAAAMGSIAPRLGRGGWRVLDGPGPVIDTQGHLLVAETQPDVDAAVMSELAARFPRRRSEAVVPPGRYAVTDVILVGVPAHDGGQAPQSEGLAEMLEVGLALPPTARSHTRGLLQRARVHTVSDFDDAALLDVLAALSTSPAVARQERRR